MPLNPSGAISLGGPTAGQSIAVELGLSPTASISLNQTDVRTLAQVPSGTIIMPTNFYGKSNVTGTQRAIFALGGTPAAVNTTNLISNTGVVAGNNSGVGTARRSSAGTTYGTDKGIIGFGENPTPATHGIGVTNLVSNTGVIASDTAAVGTGRRAPMAVGYGGDKAIFAFGTTSSSTYSSIVNLVSNTGVVASNTSTPASGRAGGAAAKYGTNGTGIFGYGITGAGRITISNLLSNTGVIASNTPGVGTARNVLAAFGYGTDKAMFGMGLNTGVSPNAFNIINLVSNTGVVSADTPTVATGRYAVVGAPYGGDKGIFGLGLTAAATQVNTTNLVSNLGIVASDTSTVAQARRDASAAGYSLT